MVAVYAHSVPGNVSRQNGIRAFGQSAMAVIYDVPLVFVVVNRCVIPDVERERERYFMWT